MSGDGNIVSPEGESAVGRIDTLPVKEPLPPLPFTYQRTHNPEEAAYKEWRVNPVTIGKRKNQPRSDEEIVESVKYHREGEDWFTWDYWREKGTPQEQVEFSVDGKPITVYNFSPDKPFTEDHLERAKRVFQELSSHFPQVLDQVRWILIDNEQLPSALGDPELYPTNGMAQAKWKSFRLFPRGMELFTYRIPKTSNFEGVVTHELAHLIEDEFEKEWREKFQWEFCLDYEDDWEWKQSPDATMKRPFNKHTGEMAAMAKFPLQPDQSVTSYAKIDWNEDLCESIAAYIHDPELLQRVSPDKFTIIERHDAKKPKPEVSGQRVAKNEIKLPEIKPETVLYYVDEAKDNPRTVVLEEFTE